MSDFVSINEAAIETGLSRGYLRKRAREGSIPVIRLGNDKRTGAYFVNLDALRRQLAKESNGQNEGGHE